MNAKPGQDAAMPRRTQSNGSGLIKVLQILVVIAIIAILIAFMLPSVRTARGAARRTQCKNNLKLIALALRNYESAYNALPPAYTVDANGNPLHSWRTLILPYLEEKALYDKIDLTQAWDVPANADAFKTNVATYQCPELIEPGHSTTYMAIVASNSCFRPTEPRLLSEITDNHAQTLMVVEVELDHSVPWMAPRDADEAMFLAFGPESKLGHPGGTQAAFVDGTVRFLVANMEPKIRRALISIAGKEQLEP
jgi:type II secretory pathway pseudopilin PulG